MLFFNFLELDSKILTMLLYLEGTPVVFVEGGVCNLGKGSAHALVRSVKRAIWPLFIPNWEDRSTAFKLRSSGRLFPEDSSLSPYWSRERSCRYDLTSSAAYSKLDSLETDSYDTHTHKLVCS